MIAMAHNPETQEKIHSLHQYMQDWAKTLPGRVQQRMSCELLADLAVCLASDTTIFEIVNSLLDIQHIIEKDLFHQRVILRNGFAASMMNLSKKGLSDDELKERQEQLQSGHTEELRRFDLNTLQQFDDKVAEQQQVLEQAGVPGFRQTTDPLEITVQMCLLDFIIRSGKVVYRL